MATRVTAVAAALLVVAGCSSDATDSGHTVRADQGATTTSVAETTGGGSAAERPDGYTAAQADLWFDALVDVGMLADRGPLDLQQLIADGSALYVGRIAAAPAVLTSEVPLPENFQTTPGEPPMLQSALVVLIAVEGSSTPVPIYFDLGTSEPAKERRAEELAPPQGTRILVVSDVEPVRVLLGLGIALETSDGELAVGGPLSPMDEATATRSSANSATRFDELVATLSGSTP